MKKHLVRHDQHNDTGSSTPSNLPVVHLEIVRGAAHHRTRPINVSTFLVGTAEDCDMVLGDPQFALVHFYILRNERTVTIRHLGSVPDVTLNGKPVHTAVLQNEDRIRSGPYEFRIRIRWAKTDGELDDSPKVIESQPIAGPKRSPLQLAEHLLHDIRNEILCNESPLRIFSENKNLDIKKPTREAS